MVSQNALAVMFHSLFATNQSNEQSFFKKISFCIKALIDNRGIGKNPSHYDETLKTRKE